MKSIYRILAVVALFLFPFQLIKTEPALAAIETATFAGGCFWCMEAPFDKLPGVVSVTAGYSGGKEKNPTYEQVSAGGTGHAEVVQIVFDPAKTSYSRLLDIFWRSRHVDEKELQALSQLAVKLLTEDNL